MTQLDSIVIVGASLAGMHAAHTLRREGFAGRLVIADADPHTPYDKPPLSKQVLKGDWDADRITLAAANEELDVDYRLGWRATGLDLAARRVTLEATSADGGETVLDYDGLVLATGAAARRLPGTDGIEGLHVLRTLDDCLALRADLDRQPARVAVIGAGFIGAEVAATCRARELEVTLIEALEVPLERALGREMGMLTAEIHREHGVDVRLGVGVDGFDTDGAGRVSAVRLADGTTVDAEVVVVGVGVYPNTAWLESSGLTLDNGVVVDETLLAAPGVVAAGDIARWPSRRFGELLRIEHWENAIQMGEAAARRLLVADGTAADEIPIYDPIPWFWSDQYDRKIQLTGRSGADDQVEVVHGSTDERRFVALYGREGRVVGVLGMNRPRHVMQLRSLVIDAVPWEDGLAQGRALA
jgi:3-phenylpropionate/trans-cinnamate dioxygenase ferredoxin reductase subunit